MLKFNYYETGSTDAAYNLAVEEVLLNSLQEDDPPIFILWQNSPSVIIGRHQNALAEVNISELKQRKIKLLRRCSGGGAVYHDLGNLNFSFILANKKGGEIKSQEARQLLYSTLQSPSKQRHLSDTLPGKDSELLAPILRCLKSFGLNVKMEGRNDISLLGNGKFSGLAGRGILGKYLLHGTIMYDVDLNVLEQLLKVDPEKIKSKGVASIRARVANLKEHLSISLQDLWGGLRDSYPINNMTLPEEIRAQAQALCDSRYALDDWNLAQSPAADLMLKKSFAFGSLQLRLFVKKNLIVKAQINGDFLTPLNLEEQIPLHYLEEALIGQAFDKPCTWAQAWRGFDLSKVFEGRVSQGEVLAWLEKSLD